MHKTRASRGFNLYAIKDNVEEEFTSLILARNDVGAIRKATILVIQERPLRDMEVYRIGEFNEETGEVKPTKQELIKWDIYALPENQAEALEPIGGMPKEN